MRVTSTFLLKIAAGFLLLVPPFVVLYTMSIGIYNFFWFSSLSMEELRKLPVCDPREVGRSIVYSLMTGMCLPVVLYFLGITLFRKLRKAREFDDHEIHLLQTLTFFMMTLILLELIILIYSNSEPDVLIPASPEWDRMEIRE